MTSQDYNNLPLMLSPSKLAEIFDVSPRTITRWLDDGYMPSVIVGNRRYVDREDFISYIKENKVQ